MVGATLGLLAFLLAFTFGMAADHFHARKVALLEEVNAIRTTDLLTGVIGEPQRTAVRKVLRDYVGEQLQWAGVEQGPRGPLSERVARSIVGAGRRRRRAEPRRSGRLSQLGDQSDRTRAERVMVRERRRDRGPGPRASRVDRVGDGHYPPPSTETLHHPAVRSLPSRTCSVPGTGASPQSFSMTPTAAPGHRSSLGLHER